jgi:hypothetical protein
MPIALYQLRPARIAGRLTLGFRTLHDYNRAMRVIIAGDRFWSCEELAGRVVNRPLARYGPRLTIVQGGFPRIDQSLAVACREIGIGAGLCLAEFSHLGDYRYQNGELLRRGAHMCLIFHRSALDDVSKDLADQVASVGVPVWLVDNEAGRPRRIGARGSTSG